jgi:DNA polymerase III subunit gamma/tau
MSNEHLATKYRPESFEEVIGQDVAVNSIRGMLKKENLPGTLLFTGPRSTGKTTLAQLIALYANCSKTGMAEACGKCQSCSGTLGMIRGTSKHPDVVMLDVASYGGVDDMRALGQKARLMPMNKFRFFILDEAHGITRQGFEALLKTLEKPPNSTRFILCTTNPEKLPITLQSRCPTIHLQPIPEKETAKLLYRVAGWEGFNGVSKKDMQKACLSISAAVNGYPREALGVLGTLISYVSEVGDEDIDLEAIVPEVLEQSASFKPYLLVQHYLDGILAGRFGLTFKTIKDSPNHTFFVQQLIESIQQILYLWIDPNTLADKNKLYMLNKVEVPTQPKDGALRREYVLALGGFLEKTLLAQERIKSYLMDPAAVLQSLTLESMKMDRPWNNDNAG